MNNTPDMILVPRSPTENMVEAGRKAMEQQDPVRVSHARVIWLWQDMLKAAPDQFEPLENAFRGAMDIIKTQAEQLRILEEENNTLKEAVLGTAKFFETRGYSLNAPAFKKIKAAVEACA